MIGRKELPFPTYRKWLKAFRDLTYIFYGSRGTIIEKSCRGGMCRECVYSYNVS